MKKILNILCVILVCFFFQQVDVYANVKTFDRTEQNLLVPDNVVVTDENKKAILDTPAVDVGDKIYDFGNILTKDEEKKLLSNVLEFINKTDIDLVFLTTRDTNFYSVEDYAYQFYDYNSFKKDGIIFLILVGEKNQIFMGTSGNINKYYSSERINQILEYVIKYIDKKDYYKGLDIYTKIIDGFYNIDNKVEVNIENNGKVVIKFLWIDILIFTIAGTFIIVFFTLHFVNKRKNIQFNREYIDNKTFFINKELEVNLGKNIEKNKK